MQAGFATQTGSATDTAGRKVAAPPITEIAPHFPELEILEVLGCGGMGAVYKARQKQLGRVVALKVLPPGLGTDPAFAERFTREAQALAQLNHQGIVTLYEFGRTPNGLYFFLMEFVEGVNLRALLQTGRLSPREALAIVPQICDALQYAHDQGIVHRDIKPDNILLDRRGRVKVADFGVAKLLSSEQETRPTGAGAPLTGELTTAGHLLGTPTYMAPEQMARPSEVDHRADIYALGVVLYQMLTGELPGKQIEPPSTKVEIDVRLDEIVLRALQKEPSRRYQQASQVKTEVETVLATEGSHSGQQPAPAAADHSPRWWHRRPVRIALRVLFALLLVDFALPHVTRGGASPAPTLTIGCLHPWLANIPFTQEDGTVLRRTRVDVLAPSFASGAAALLVGIALGVSRPNSSRRKLSRAALAGAIWVVLYFLNWIFAYTPPGWALTQSIRATGIGLLIELLLVLPLTVLGFSAFIGGPVMGVVALRQIRRARADTHGLGLALFDILFFPLWFLNGWVLWLGCELTGQIHSPGSPSAGAPDWAMRWPPIVALIISTAAIRVAWKLAQRFVTRPCPPEPAASHVTGTWAEVFKQSALRLALVVLIETALLETLEQASLHWRESTSEEWGLALMVLTLAGLVWASWPGLHLRRSIPLLLAGTVISGFLVLGLNNLYAWYVRPNLGLYREADWVIQNAGWQRQHRAGIATHLWNRKRVAEFGPAGHARLGEGSQFQRALDLDAGKTEPGESADLLAHTTNGQFTLEGIRMAVAPVSLEDWDRAKPQDIADYFSLEWQTPKPQIILWPLAEYWCSERFATRQSAPQWTLSNTNTVGAYFFRTLDGNMGVLELTVVPGAAEATVRYKKVRAP